MGATDSLEAVSRLYFKDLALAPHTAPRSKIVAIFRCLPGFFEVSRLHLLLSSRSKRALHPRPRGPPRSIFDSPKTADEKFLRNFRCDLNGSIFREQQMIKSTTMTNIITTASPNCFAKERAGKHTNTSPFSQPANSPKALPRLKVPKAPIKSNKIRCGKAHGKKKERLIVERQVNQSETTFCVQIRRQIGGKKLSLSETFSTMKLAKAWRDRKLAEIELGRIKPEQIERHDTHLVCDVLKRRLSDGKSLEKSGVQMLNLLINHPLCQKDASKIDTDWFGSIADALLAREITPQTVAGYISTLSYALKWGARRQMLVSSLVVQTAMEILWEDEVLTVLPRRGLRRGAACLRFGASV
jgi:hypothetical protein